MRTPVVMGNWKLNGTKATVADLIKTFAGVANDAYENGDSDVCLHMERTTSGQVYTSGVWNPHTI